MDISRDEAHSAGTHPWARALVVEDDPLMRSLARRILQPDLAAVFEADSGEAALKLIEQGDPPLDLVLTDLLLPGITGLDIVAVLRRYRPDLALLVMTGAVNVEFARELTDDYRVPIITKPFRPDLLRHAVHRALARRELLTRGARARAQARALRGIAGEARAAMGQQVGRTGELVDAARALVYERERSVTTPQTQPREQRCHARSAHLAHVHECVETTAHGTQHRCYCGTWFGGGDLG
jgi:DNA-binding NtrC family response regulator